MDSVFSYEQYCTFLDKNIIVQEIFTSSGEKIVLCTNSKCDNNEKGCKNKLRLLTE